MDRPTPVVGAGAVYQVDQVGQGKALLAVAAMAAQATAQAATSGALKSVILARNA